MAGCDRREEVDALLKGQIQEKMAEAEAAEAEATPESIMMSTMTEESEKERTDRELLVVRPAGA